MMVITSLKKKKKAIATEIKLQFKSKESPSGFK